MIIKLRDIRDSKQVLTKLLNANFSVNVSFKLREAIDFINKQLIFLEEERTKLVKKFGVWDEKQLVFEVKDKAKEILFHEELNKILDTEIETPYEKFVLTPEDFKYQEYDSALLKFVNKDLHFSAIELDTLCKIIIDIKI